VTGTAISCLEYVVHLVCRRPLIAGATGRI
jgi:hypothetical protein